MVIPACARESQVFDGTLIANLYPSIFMNIRAT
ncbi:hypothetical protein Oscil6304_1936 [Oscillatoria acuminata PCC 6304]|uniref:Uncharacterized protein n=1 Tax=Oscillatoria acuminata PCC 6304 TaxID=56110 RepID=K9THI2_9CYAN|nr:hypothetical protein Oscil6304_1936 [Oscillatoria acuminata PCC 6304]